MARDCGCAGRVCSCSIVSDDLDISGGGSSNSPYTISFKPGGGFVVAGVEGKQIIGNGGDPNSAKTQNVKLLVTATRVNPTNAIEQNFVGWSHYSGTPGPSVGTLQGGSFESYAHANTADLGEVLGFEGIGYGDGDPGRSIDLVIGSMGTALVRGDVHVDLAVAIRGRGIEAIDASTLDEARTLDLQQPLHGTIRRTLYGIGLHHFRKGTPTNTIEIATSAGSLRWAITDNRITGYASDGSSDRVIIDNNDSADQRLQVSYFLATTKGLRIVSLNAAASGHAIEYVRAGSTRFTLDAAGQITTINGVGARITAGTGTPEGAVTAPVGSLYLRTDGGAGTTLYVKQTGAGNTGWVGK